MVIGKEALKAAFDGLVEETREMLKRTADRIRKFAEAQRDSLATDMSIEIPGGRAGQDGLFIDYFSVTTKGPKHGHFSLHMPQDPEGLKAKAPSSWLWGV
tara:strand:- start:133 stop:432 length:300 start_codon:yes stop_codon:yes gene_type:complete